MCSVRCGVMCLPKTHFSRDALAIWTKYGQNMNLNLKLITMWTFTTVPHVSPILSLPVPHTSLSVLFPIPCQFLEWKLFGAGPRCVLCKAQCTLVALYKKLFSFSSSSPQKPLGREQEGSVCSWQLLSVIFLRKKKDYK